MPWFPADSANDTVVIAATLATIGWIYTARKSRTIARKQHTIDIMLKANFDRDMRVAHKMIAPYIQRKNPDPFPEDGNTDYEKLIPFLRMILNHYEFLAAGIRRGDLDEILVIDAQRGAILNAFERSEAHIFAVRDRRRSQAIYEHLEWLHRRWEKLPPRWYIRWCERLKGSPFQGSRNKVRD
jgi:hypothetical protein